MSQDRRRFERVAVGPGEGRVRIRRLEEEQYAVAGQVHDISEAGVRMRLDEPLDPGTAVAIELDLPWVEPAADGERAVYVFADITWAEEADLPGPVRTAAEFTRFCRGEDRERLARALESRGVGRAA